MFAKAALEISGRHRLPYWDNAIIATAQALGRDEVLSEYMQDGRRVGSLLVDPFQ